MKHKTIFGAGAMLLACLGLGFGTASAQLSPEEGGAFGVVGTGTATIERQPEILRMEVMLSAEGKDVKEALGKLKEKETAAKEKLAKLGVTEASVSFGDAAPQDLNQQQQMEQMIRMRTGRAPKAKPGPATVTLNATLKAEWPLTSKTGDDLLVESTGIRDKVKEADVVGEKAKPATPEQEEAAEEAQGLNNDGQPNPHDPQFVFVSKISDDDRAKAQAEAYKKAAKDAERLAKASGGQLGPIRVLLSRTMGNNYGNARYYDPYRQQAYYNMNNGDDDDTSTEAIGAQAGKVSYRVTVSAAFAIK